MRLIGDGVVDRDGVPGLASRLGYTERHLHRILTAELGAGPLALAPGTARPDGPHSHRDHRPGAGGHRVRGGFSAASGSSTTTILEAYGRPPSDLRASRAASWSGGGTIGLRLAYRRPLHAASLLEFLALRAVPGVEECDGRMYRRGLTLPHGGATVELTPVDRWVTARLRLDDLRDLAPAVARCRRLFDLDADPIAVDSMLASTRRWLGRSRKSQACACLGRSTGLRQRCARSSASR
jgi:AraC family transcriptional regulator of adaptative response / DNA-3-methyladenine glycosylase II